MIKLDELGENEPFLLPEGWIWTSVGTISKRIHYGYTASATGNNIGPKFLRITDIQDNSVNWETVPFCKIDPHEKQKYLLREGDIVFARTGATVGKSFLIRSNVPEAVFASYLLRIVLPECIDNRFIFNFFQSPLYWSQISRAKIGIGQPNVNAQTLSRLPCPLAPFPEQGRIVSKVEELFPKLDAGVKSLETVRAQLKRYRQSVLKSAFEGKLTEEWRRIHRDELEPASGLLERIKEERRKSAAGKYRELLPVDTSNLPEIPEGWVWTRLGEVLIQSDHRFDPKSSSDRRFIGLEHIESNTGKLLGFGNSSETRSTKTQFGKGDLLLGKLRPYLNKVLVADFEGVCSTDILVFKRNEFANNSFLAKRLLRDDFVKYVTQRMSGVQHPRVNYQTVSSYVIALPPLVEQDRIAEEIERHFSIADMVGKIIVGSLRQAEKLRQSILKRAFEGKLVPQDPSDESANVLLERIRSLKIQTMQDHEAKKGRKRNDPKQRRLV